MRLARETRGIALRDISEQTRISMRYLEAIEADDYRRLPGGIFNSSLIRAYAKHIDYDEQKEIEEYYTKMNESGETTDSLESATTISGVHRKWREPPLLTVVLAIILWLWLSAHGPRGISTSTESSRRRRLRAMRVSCSRWGGN